MGTFPYRRGKGGISMDLNKIYKDRGVIAEERFLCGKPINSSESGEINYNGIQKLNRCVVNSGSDYAILNLDGLKFKYGESDYLYKLVFVTFHDVIFSPGILTGTGLQDQWKIGLKSNGVEVFYLHAHPERSGDRVRVTYNDVNGNVTDFGNYILYANQRADITIPLKFGYKRPRVYYNGVIQTFKEYTDSPPSFEIENMSLYPFISVKNVGAVSTISLNGVSIRAYGEHDPNILYN
jgi:hypothetical protein